MQAFVIRGDALEEGRDPGGVPGKNGFPGLQVSDAETLSLQKSAKSRSKNAELAALRQLHFCS